MYKWILLNKCTIGNDMKSKIKTCLIQYNNTICSIFQLVEQPLLLVISISENAISCYFAYIS